jgi:hypothetical protein
MGWGQGDPWKGGEGEKWWRGGTDRDNNNDPDTVHP